ncbi:CAP domain-containing protein [Burkholderia cepacia]|jgi:uncharacterized protein YkwD|uniref:CAP domain-containing protein n=1 Tax=Burkholderia contaminans TaxID=488447 RepID=A0ABD7YG73_9BURK|nr:MULTISPECIES: CAP domain-containing protein [Burkholderia]EKS9798990.1 CAP domain-containing protein [Burkholderia cepacia]EKS9805944.1 CAP domain-containing protein [Burkholderia cepacia]EKS9813492.1 CAP domain-containing protein [Burkholderia cepacia]EKS9820331.1 CAP domain-containing protein [Burkholderia cepacia]EKS9828196.1 CAP domain-containing protein [Burkholderia cepacia]
MMIKHSKGRFAAVVVAAMLAACGGGGDGGSASTGTSNPGAGNGAGSGSTNGGSASAALPPQTSVPNPTYGAASAEAQAFATLNAYRQALGVGLLRQDAVLDIAALAHAKYELTNLGSGAISGLAHDESSSLPGFTGSWPLQRAQAAGAPKNQWVGENIGSAFAATPPGTPGADCVNQLLATVYHLQGVTSNTESVGVGVASTTPTATTPGVGSVCVFDLGTSTGVARNPDPNNPTDVNASPASGGQQFATNLVVSSPYDGETGVSTTMVTETPNPAPDLSAPGRPIMVRVNAATGNTLTVSSFQLVDSTGGAVAARILVPQSAVAGSTAKVTADSNNILFAGVAFLLPLSPLKPNTTYTVTFSGARDGVAVSVTRTFTTGAK